MSNPKKVIVALLVQIHGRAIASVNQAPLIQHDVRGQFGHPVCVLLCTGLKGRFIQFTLT